MKKIIQYFVNNQLIVNVITIFVIIAGYITYTQIQREGYPPVEEPGVTIFTYFGDASPEDVELNITIPIENELKKIEGIEKYYSRSYENSSLFFVHFDDDYEDIEKIKNDIRRGLDSINDFPEELDNRPMMFGWGAKYDNLIFIGLSGKGLARKKLQKQADNLKDNLLQSPYISKVNMHGKYWREIKIKIDLDRINKKQITFYEIMNAIRSHNVNESSGTITSYTSEKNIVTLSQFTNLLDIKNIIVRSNFSGDHIRLKDVAAVYDHYDEGKTKLRFNGKKGIFLEVFKKKSADIIDTVKNVNYIIDRYKNQNRNSKLEISFLRDKSQETKSRLRIVKNNAFLGFILVIIILFIFLSFKNAIWTVVGIPFSVFFGLLFFPVFGISLNSVSLLGIILVLGMIVDDAIIISENIHRHKIISRAKGNYAVDAAIEVGFAVFTTVLTTFVVFIPLYFMQGVMGKYIHDIPILVFLLLSGSLFEAFFMLPGHCFHILKNNMKYILGFLMGFLLVYMAGEIYWNLKINFKISLAIIGGIIGVILFKSFYHEDIKLEEKAYIVWLRNNYKKILQKIFRFRYPALIIIILIAIIGSVVGTRMPFLMFPEVETNLIRITGEIKDKNSIDYTSDKVKKIENIVQSTYNKKILQSYIAIIGNDNYPERFEMRLFLTPEADRQVKSEEIIDRMRRLFKEEGEFINLKFNKSGGGPTIGNNISIQVNSNFNEPRNKVAAQIVSELKSIDGCLDVTRSDSNKKAELRIIPKYEEVARHKISVEQIKEIISIAYEGLEVTEVQTPDDKIPYKIILDDKYRNKISSIKNLKIRTSSGNFTSIKSLVDIVKSEAPSEINRYNGKRTVTIFADFDVNKVKAVELYQLFKKKYNNISEKYPDVSVNIGGAAEFSSDTLDSLTAKLIIAIAGVYLLLIFLFRSLTQPFIVMLAIPFGIIGVVFAFKIHNMPLSFMGIMGCIGLSGVVVNDSLVMVDYINKLKIKFKNRDITQLVTEGAVTRLRPILLTTLTTFFGLLPTAYGMGGKDALIYPAAISLSWGLFFATFLTLFILPVFYIIEDDIKRIIKKIEIFN